MTHASNRPPSSLLNDTLRLLKAHLPPEGHTMRNQVLRAIAKAAEVDIDWTRRVLTGATPNPGVVTVQRLHDYLVLLPAPQPWPAMPLPAAADIASVLE